MTSVLTSGEEKDRIISLVPIEKEKKTVQLKATTTNERQNWLEDISQYVAPFHTLSHEKKTLRLALLFRVLLVLSHIHHALQRALGVPSPNVPHKNADA